MLYRPDAFDSGQETLDHRPRPASADMSPDREPSDPAAEGHPSRADLRAAAAGSRNPAAYM